MTNKNFYQILGVTQDAEDFVIRAAYKALAQRYHPDKYQGSSDEAIAKMHLINEAYGILSDTQKRKIYDDELKNSSNNQSSKHENQKEIVSETEMQWAVVIEFHEDIAKSFSRLKVFSDDLAEQFKLEILEHKEFSEYESIMMRMENAFLESHFGDDPKLISFVKELFLEGNKQAVKDLNNVLIALGKGANIPDILERFESKYPTQRLKREAEERKRAIEAENQRKELAEKERKRAIDFEILKNQQKAIMRREIIEDELETRVQEYEAAKTRHVIHSQNKLDSIRQELQEKNKKYLKIILAASVVFVLIILFW